MRYQFIGAHQTEHRLARLCAALEVSRSGYYAWRTRPASARAQANRVLVERMRQLHAATKERYGAVKLWRALRTAGLPCGRHRVARLRRQDGLMARRMRRFRAGVDDHQFVPPAPHPPPQGFGAPAAKRSLAGELA